MCRTNSTPCRKRAWPHFSAMLPKEFGNMRGGRYQTLGAKPGTTSPRPPPPATLTYADAETKPSARSADATPRTPPTPTTSTWPWACDRPHTAMGTETTHAAANADATADEENQAVATRPDAARNDTRQETN